jgi:hypothetical protein
MDDDEITVRWIASEIVTIPIPRRPAPFERKLWSWQGHFHDGDQSTRRFTKIGRYEDRYT